jgi:hypothetical protein
MKMELVYTMPYESAEEKQKARDLRFELYETYKYVDIYPNGLSEIRLIATND